MTQYMHITHKQREHYFIVINIERDIGYKHIYLGIKVVNRDLLSSVEQM